jgi:ATP synthase protein I
MFAAVGLQFGVVAVLALAAALAAGWPAAKGLLFGGLAAAVPSALLALRLSMHSGRSPESYPLVFFAGELVKIGLTVALLAAIVRWQPDIRWLPLIIGLVAALKAPLLLPVVLHGARAMRMRGIGG